MRILNCAHSVTIHLLQGCCQSNTMWQPVQIVGSETAGSVPQSHSPALAHVVPSTRAGADERQSSNEAAVEAENPAGVNLCLRVHFSRCPN